MRFFASSSLAVLVSPSQYLHFYFLFSSSLPPLYIILDIINSSLLIHIIILQKEGRTNQLQSVIYFHTHQMTKVALGTLQQLNMSYTH